MAIAFVRGINAEASSSGNNVSGTLDCTGVDFVVIGIQDDSGGGISSVTLGGNAMTLTDSVDQTSAGNGRQYMYIYVGPPTGNQTISVTRNTTSSARRAFEAAGYSGANQTGQPDAHTSTTATASSFSPSLSSVANNCWQVQWVVSSGSAITLSSGGTVRNTPLSAGQKLADSNAAITPAGSYSMTWTQTGTPLIGACVITIAPSVATGTEGNFLIFM